MSRPGIMLLKKLFCNAVTGALIGGAVAGSVGVFTTGIYAAACYADVGKQLKGGGLTLDPVAVRGDEDEKRKILRKHFPCLSELDNRVSYSALGTIALTLGGAFVGRAMGRRLGRRIDSNLDKNEP